LHNKSEHRNYKNGRKKNGTVDSDEGEQQKVDSSDGDTVALENDFKILQI